MIDAKPSVLICEDETALRHTLAKSLTAFGFRTIETATGEQALLQLRRESATVVLLDLNMPGIGGLEACERIRALLPRIQIIVVSVRRDEVDKVKALDAGADDFVTKPFQLHELAARIRAAVRRFMTPDANKDADITVGTITLFPSRHRVFKNGVEVRLTPKEFEVLRVLMSHRERPISHHKLLSLVWGDEFGNEKEYLRTYISQLRKKLEDDPANPKYLTTDNYIGYRFQTPD